MKYANLSTLSLLFFYSFVWAQNYPQGDFIFPINPGQQGYLAGTFGELRSNHFHSGIDIKTGGQQGLKVYAAAEGYVSRIKIGRGGYGKTLYIDHKNGYTTVYAHLKNFAPKIDSIIRAEQYRVKSYSVNFFPEKNSIKIQQKEIIALSGNTGGSMGPHLHFEIRNRKQEPINPLYFGFEEIRDHVKPSIRNIAFSPISFESRINGRFSDIYYKIEDNKFKENDTVFVQGEFYLNIDAIDRLDGASNNNGIARIEAKLDGKTFYDMVVDQFSFGHTRMINEHINYRLYKDFGKRYYKLQYNPKNRLGFYKIFKNDGVLEISDHKNHMIEVIVHDNYGNNSKVTIPLKNTDFIVYPKKESTVPQHQVIGETMIISMPTRKELPITAKAFQKEKIINPSYQTKSNTVYLIDLKTIVPNSISSDSTIFTFPFAHLIYPDKGYEFHSNNWELTIPKGAFYNPFLLTFDTLLNGFKIGDIHEPLYKKFTVSRSNKNISNKKISAYTQNSKGQYTLENTKTHGGSVYVRSRDMGHFLFLTDTVPPTIEEVQINDKLIIFKIDDALSGINQINAYLNGDWLLMNYDYKSKKIWSETANKNTNLKGYLSIEISDKQGNITKFAKKIP